MKKKRIKYIMYTCLGIFCIYSLLSIFVLKKNDPLIKMLIKIVLGERLIPGYVKYNNVLKVWVPRGMYVDKSKDKELFIGLGNKGKYAYSGSLYIKPLEPVMIDGFSTETIIIDNKIVTVLNYKGNFSNEIFHIFYFPEGLNIFLIGLGFHEDRKEFEELIGSIKWL